MTRIVRAALLGAVILSLVAVAGCGDTAADNDYVEAVNKAQQAFADNIQQVSSSASSPDKAGEVFDQLSNGVDKVISDLRAVEPPDDVKALHERLITEMGTFKEAIGKAGKAIQSGSIERITEAQAEFATEVSQVGTNISQTIDQINQQLQS